MRPLGTNDRQSLRNAVVALIHLVRVLALPEGVSATAMTAPRLSPIQVAALTLAAALGTAILLAVVIGNG